MEQAELRTRLQYWNGTDTTGGATVIYQHDCERCVPLGEFEGCDLYYCPTGGLPDTVIARYGDEGSEYTSGVALAGLDPRLGEAMRRAIAQGITIIADPPRAGL